MDNLLKNNKHLMKEYNYKKNKDIDLDTLTCGSSKKIWWLCPNKHEYLSDPHHRSIGTGCPYCSGQKVLKGFNDLKTTNKNIIEYWDFKKNQEVDPDNITNGSGKKVWWKCPKCNYEWNSQIYSMVKNRGCPKCNRENGIIKRDKDRVIKTGSLEDNYPELVKEWDYKKNKILPSNISPHSNKKIWWLCPQNHSYESSPNKRTSGRGCPYCSNHKLLVGFNDLDTTNPELVKEWDYKKNSNIKPSHFTFGSAKKVWWICSVCNNSYRASISNRVRGTGCPVCNHMTVKVGINDFKSRFPILVEEWDYKKNGDLLPENISYGSGKNVWWICPRCGCSYKSAICNRTRGSSCPKCKSEIQTSFPEQAIFYYLKKVVECESRKKINNKEIDVFLPKYNIGIEYNGSRYHQDKSKDIDKINFFKNLGIKIISINEGNDNVVKKDNIQYIYTANHKYLDWLIYELFKLLKLEKTKIDIKKDSIFIYEQYIQSEKNNSLYVKFPEIAREWDYEKNGSITPKLVRPRSIKKFWWKCSKGHSYSASINARSNGTNCPYCANQKILKGFNDLESLFPEIVVEWDYEKNNILPSNVTSKTSKRVWWKCSKGHSYSMRISHRTDGSGCPICATKTRMRSRNDNYIKIKGSLEDNYPELSKEWDYEKNNGKTPRDVLAHSGKKVWWKCPKGHSYEADPNHRTTGRGCPICAGKKKK